MKKKWTMALTVLVLFAVLLSGCGGSSGSSGSSNASGSSDASGSPSSNNGDVGASAEQEPAGDLLDKITEAGVLVIGTEGTYAPNSYHDEDGNLTGFDVEVARAIAGKLGVEAQFVEAEWDSLFASMDSGRVDVVINEVEYSEARAEKYDFSAPYTYVHGALLVAEDNGDITSFDDLKGKKAAQNLTSSWGQLAESYGRGDRQRGCRCPVNGTDRDRAGRRYIKRRNRFLLLFDRPSQHAGEDCRYDGFHHLLSGPRTQGK